METWGLLDGHIPVERTWAEDGDKEERDPGLCLLTEEQSPQMPATNMAQDSQDPPERSDIERDVASQLLPTPVAKPGCSQLSALRADGGGEG